MTVQPFNEFIVKAASRCNLDCDYCYEYNLGDASWKAQPKIMSEDTAQALGKRIAEHASLHSLRNVFVSFHGGEVLLLGPYRLQRICQILRDEVHDATKISFSMQTNATLINDRFIDVIKEYEIAVSVSFDGDQDAHDRHRFDHKGRGSYERAMRGLDSLRRGAPEYLAGVLAVIDLQNDPLRTFDAIAALGVGHVDFLLPHWHWEKPPPRPKGDPVEYGRWLWEIYRAWTADRHVGVEVRFLVNIVSQLAGGASIYEAMTLDPVTLVVIAADGSLEAVDSIKSTASGLQQTGLNVHSSSFDAALDARLISLRQSGEGQLCAECRACRFKRECAGGYFPHRWGRGKQFDNPSVYCEDLYWLISKIYEDLASRRTKRENLRNCPPR